jgi:UrcA family protein
MKTWTIALTAASLAISGMAAPAFAGGVVKRSQDVTYADLDLNTMGGQQTLERRLEAAVREVCRGADARMDTQTRRDKQACLAKARTSAKRQMAVVLEDERRGG